VNKLKELSTRKSVRLKGFDYSSSGYYFITICVKDRREALGIVVLNAPLHVPYVQLSECGIFVESQIQKINQIYPCVHIDNHIVMPNHVHMLAAVENGKHGSASPTKAMIPQVVQSLKSMTTKKFGNNIWQRSYHDHIIRNVADFQRTWEYIDNNPSRWNEDVFYTCKETVFHKCK